MLLVAPPPPPLPAIEVSYIGGPTVLIEIDGYRIVTDPTFDPAKTVYPGPVTLEKTQDPAIAADALGDIDLVLLSHDEHIDNLDQKGRDLVKRTKATFTTESGARRMGGNTIGLANWQSRTVRTPGGTELKITATPARHGPVGIEKLVGDVIGFVISRADTGEDLLYATGDTVWYEGINEVSRRFKPHAVLVFTGAAEPETVPFRLTMDKNDTIEIAHAFPQSIVIPVHHEGWSHFREPVGIIQNAFGLLGLGPRLQLLERGVKTRLTKSQDSPTT